MAVILTEDATMKHRACRSIIASTMSPLNSVSAPHSTDTDSISWEKKDRHIPMQPSYRCNQSLLVCPSLDASTESDTHRTTRLQRCLFGHATDQRSSNSPLLMKVYWTQRWKRHPLPLTFPYLLRKQNLHIIHFIPTNRHGKQPLGCDTHDMMQWHKVAHKQST
jgi:hypothetical protein